MSRAPATRRLVGWLDQRLGAAGFARTALNKVFPDHWSFMIGELALYCFTVLVLTGVYLTFFFHASPTEVIYQGSYGPLRGLPMSEAYRSTIDISFDVRAGLVMRQTHHWAALLFVASIVVHLARVFFTGAFRRPREINWIIGVTLLILSMVNGFAGYSLVDDQLSGTGLRIGYSVVLSVPVIGTWMASLLFGGEFPGSDIISRLFVLHILVLPVLIVALLTVHLAIVVRHKHTQFPGPGRLDTNVVGERLWPSYAAKAVGLFFLTTAVLCLLGGLLQINPIWLFGPFNPAQVSAASQPDWYMGWLDGALRIMPPWEIRAFGFVIPNPFFPGALLGGLTFGLLYAWPFLEARATGDRAEHHLCERPRTRPLRTALGVATLAFYTVCLLGGAADVIATTLGLSVNAVLESFRVAIFVVPLACGWMTYRLCVELSARDGLAVTVRGRLRPGDGSEPRTRRATSRRSRRRAEPTPGRE
ncbi:MAG TPA: ubiquinol-cytochrome c reductase cytochrome b subunit [Acidimicrobiia bacterium]|nr:ubiquinol-cytochrome c reductase cytochrome b subunit [Acidimicrobiia bacterium]